MFKLLSQQGLTIYESIKEMPSFVDLKDQKVFLNMRAHVLEAKAHEEVIKPLQHKLESWIFSMLTISHTLIAPSQFYDALMKMIEDKDILLKQQQKAKRYPTLVLILALSVLMAYVYVILPTYMSIFSNMGQGQSSLSLWITQKSTDSIFMIGISIGFIFLYGICTYLIKRFKQSLLFKTYQSPTKYFYYYDMMMKMSVYSAQHMTFYEMFQMLMTYESNKKMKQTYQHVLFKLQNGEDLYDIFKSYTFIPKEVQMIVPLTTTRNRNQTFTYLSKHYQTLYIESMERLQSLIEPMLLLVLGALIMMIGYLMYQPLLEFYNSIGSGL